MVYTNFVIFRKNVFNFKFLCVFITKIIKKKNKDETDLSALAC